MGLPLLIQVEVQRATVVLIINSDSMGKGDDNLGKTLMASFVRKLWASKRTPEVILFYNSGVRLLVQDSALSLEFKAMSDSGVELLACGTCVDFYGIREDIQPGIVSNMQEMVDRMVEAERILTI